jgi:hypothetical protein
MHIGRGSEPVFDIDRKQRDQGRQNAKRDIGRGIIGAVQGKIEPAIAARRIKGANALEKIPLAA